jgi:hypothetical protein
MLRLKMKTLPRSNQQHNDRTLHMIALYEIRPFSFEQRPELLLIDEVHTIYLLVSGT